MWRALHRHSLESFSAGRSEADGRQKLTARGEQKEEEKERGEKGAIEEATRAGSRADSRFLLRPSVRSVENSSTHAEGTGLRGKQEKRSEEKRTLE